MKGLIRAPRCPFARDRLDNSDFTNPVNQRGNANVDYQYGYPIDRWMFDKNGSGVSAGYDAVNRYLYIANNSTEDGSFGALYHLIPPEKLDVGTYTLVFHEKLIGQLLITVISDDATTVLGQSAYEPNENGLITANFTLSARPAQKLFIAIYATKGITVAFDWAALYKGTYTADTLPPYVPKGYAAELAECQRYFVALHNGAERYAGNVNSEGNSWFMIPLTTAMRVSPTLTPYSLETIASGAQYFTPTGFTGVVGVNGHLVMITLSYSGGVNGAATLCDFNCDLSADL